MQADVLNGDVRAYFNENFLKNEKEIAMQDLSNCSLENGTNSLKELSISDFQRLIRKMYFEKDEERGVAGTFMWLTEEIGELATALRSGTLRECEEEFADVFAWLTTIANVAGVDLNKALADKYGTGCPGCGKLVCECPDSEKP